MSETPHALHPTPKRTLLTWALVVLFVGGGILGISLLAQSKKPKPQDPTKIKVEAMTVTTAPVSFKAVTDEIVTTGTIYAVDPVQVGAELSGLRVTSVNVEEGDFVNAGQVLATLNSSVLQAQLSQAQARQRSAAAQISKAEQPNRPEDISGLRAAQQQAEAQVTQERANLRQAEVSLRAAEQTAQRYQQVYSQGFVTAQEATERQAEVDRNRQLVLAARQRVEAAGFGVEQARQRLNLAQAGGRAEDVQIAQSTFQEIGGTIEQIQAQIDQTIIRAPDSGLVTRRDVRLGEISSNTKPFFSLARRGELELRAEVPQDDLLRLRPGMVSKVTFTGRTASGKIWQISPEINPATRLGIARIRVDEHSGVRPGMFASARVSVGQHRTLTVPSAAVQGEGGDYFVFKLVDGKAVRQTVQTGVRSNEFVEILQGLTDKDTVVVNGAGFLRNGDLVKVEDKS